MVSKPTSILYAIHCGCNVETMPLVALCNHLAPSFQVTNGTVIRNSGVAI